MSSNDTGTPTLSSTARVATATPERYAKQLVAHLGRKIPFVEDPAARTWTTTLGEASGAVTVADGELVLTAAGPDSAAVSRVEHVLGSQLERFGTRQELVVSWFRAA